VYAAEKAGRLPRIPAAVPQPSPAPQYDAELVWEEIRSIIKGAKPSIALDRLKKTLQDYAAAVPAARPVAELRDSFWGSRRSMLTASSRSSCAAKPVMPAWRS